ncbi:hypothetical protein SAMN03159341_10371 [Paenibacillus sp. 1_12]|uniref:hypothetical protein n=1 Tax=Paenibacillus sp. 1_12 TaxID=1566278 RepID=UPI0008E9C989|nr:hypothetical protein [Paenibacillus sp. 1_12]SFL07297.1 hypothetical protein SAMN03159341_10371 [Paenibacillus sp. 1_12]
MPTTKAFKRSYSVIWGMFIAALTIYTLYTSEAQASGRWNEQPGKLTLLVDTPVYDEQSTDSKPAGVISAFQSLQVTETGGSEQDSTNPSDGSWYLVKTWYGDKWLRSGSAVVKEKYYPVHMEVTFMGMEDLYDFPADDESNGGQLSPQTVTTLGQLFICNEGVPEGTQPESDHCQSWYRILTYLGEKWIAPTKTIEHYENQHSTAALTPSAAFYQEKFRSSRELEPLLSRFSIEPVSMHTENDVARLEVRRLYRHREKLNDEEVEALKNAVFQSLGGYFPLSITTFTLSDKADLVGKIMSIDNTGKRALFVNYDKWSGKEHPTPKAYWISLPDDSNIHRYGQELQLSMDDLRIGQTVEVWKAKFTLLSYPGQTIAYEITIVEDAKPGEEGIPLSIILDLDLTHIDKIELKLKEGKPIIIQELDIIQAISERMQHIRLQAADQYPAEYDTYTMSLYQADRKAIYSGNLVLQQLPYRPTTLTIDLDEFIKKLK